MKACANPKCPFHFEVGDDILRSGYVRRAVTPPIQIHPGPMSDFDAVQTANVGGVSLVPCVVGPHFEGSPTFYLCENCYKQSGISNDVS